MASPIGWKLGFGLIAYGLNPAVVGDSYLEMGQLNARARLVREAGALPEVTIGGIVSGSATIRSSRTAFSWRRRRALRSATAIFMRSFRLHGGIRQSWLELSNEDVTTAFIGGELEIVKNLFIVAEVNTRDDLFSKTPWSAGLQEQELVRLLGGRASGPQRDARNILRRNWRQLLGSGLGRQGGEQRFAPFQILGGTDIIEFPARVGQWARFSFVPQRSARCSQMNRARPLSCTRFSLSNRLSARSQIIHGALMALLGEGIRPKPRCAPARANGWLVSL